MAPKPVTLTFAGDAQSLTRTFEKVGSGAQSMAGNLDSASSQARSFGGALDTAGSAADGTTKHMRGMADLTDGLGTVLGNTAFGPVAGMAMGMADLADGIGTTVVPALKAMAVKLGLMTTATAAQTTVTGAATTAQTGLNTAMLMNPIGIVVASLAALAAGVYVVVRNWDTITAAFTSAWNWIKDKWPLLLAIITGPFGLAVLAVVTFKDDLLGIVKKIPELVGGAFDTLADILSAPFKAAFKAIKSLWNSTVGGFGFEFGGWDPPGPGSIPGIKFEIPTMHSGGIVPGIPGMEVPILALAGETVVRRGGGGGAAGPSLTVIIQTLDPVGAGPAVMRAIEEYEARNGTKFARTS